MSDDTNNNFLQVDRSFEASAFIEPNCLYSMNHTIQSTYVVGIGYTVIGFTTAEMSQCDVAAPTGDVVKRL